MAEDIKSRYDKCCKSKRIKPFTDGPRLVTKELGTALRDLEIAKKGLADNQWKWSIIQAYYSMFHATRALIFNLGLNERSHYCLGIALGYHYGLSGKFPEDLIDALQTARIMRESADYEDNFSDIGAKKLVSAAERFITESKKILKIK